MSKLHAGNLSRDTSEDTLRSAFAQDGRGVEDVTVVSDRETGRPRGFGSVETGSGADAEADVRALDGTSLDGRNIRVDEAQERVPRGGGGGRCQTRTTSGRWPHRPLR